MTAATAAAETFDPAATPMSTAQDTGRVYALLADGTTAEIRQARPGDFDAVRAMHEAMAPDNIYLRFFSYSRRSAETEARRICRDPDPDKPGSAALLALRDGELVGVASYAGLTGHPGQAEVAFAVADHMHHKGVATLLRAFAKLSTDRTVSLTVVSKLVPDGPTERLLGELSLTDKVQFVSGISDEELADLVASAEIAVVPSLYEGFSLPAVEHMASGTPLVASRTGALPEVTGDAAMLVTPGDAEELCAALRTLHDSPDERERLSQAAVARVAERFAWQAVARATVAEYRMAIAAAGRPAPTRATAEVVTPC